MRRDDSPANLDAATVHGFGREWREFTQETGALSEADKAEIFRSYFDIFPWHLVGSDSVGADIGCGSGRWATLVAPRVRRLLACDASAEALAVARRNLEGHANVDLQLASIDRLPTADGSLDFAYCLGVLHHLPDAPRRALRNCAQAQGGRAPAGLYLLCFRQPAALVSRAVAGNGHRATPDGATAAQAPDGACHPDRAARLLAARAHRRPAGSRRQAAALVAARVLSASWILCHANRCVRPLLHADGTAVHAGPDRRDVATGGVREYRFLSPRAVLVRGGVKVGVIPAHRMRRRPDRSARLPLPFAPEIQRALIRLAAFTISAGCSSRSPWAACCCARRRRQRMRS